MSSKFRAYDLVTEWRGPVRDTLSSAFEDGMERSQRIREAGGFVKWAVIAPDPDAPERAVIAGGGTPVWPPHGKSNGTAFFGEE